MTEEKLAFAAVVNPDQEINFKYHCIQFLEQKTQGTDGVDETSSLPIGAFKETDTTLYKILTSTNLKKAMESIDNDLSKLVKLKTVYDEIIYFAESPLFDETLIRRKLKKSVKNNKIDFEIIPNSEIISQLIKERNNKRRDNR